MRIVGSCILFLAVMPCFTDALFAQTASPGDVSRATKKKAEDSATPPSSIVAGNAGETAPPVIAMSSSTVNYGAKESVTAITQGASSDEWEFTVALYLWLAGIDGTVGVGDLTTDVDPGVSDILNALNFGFMGVFEARKNKLMLITDLIYLSLEETKDTTGPLFSALKANETVFMLSPVAGYRLAEKDGASLYAIAGIRFWHTSTRLEASPNQLAGRVAESSKNWADVIGGLRGQIHVSRIFSLIGRGDLGGGGSDFSYHLFGGAGIDVARSASLFVGYRYLHIKYTRDDTLFDAALKGVVLGAAFRF